MSLIDDLLQSLTPQNNRLLSTLLPYPIGPLLSGKSPDLTPPVVPWLINRMNQTSEEYDRAFNPTGYTSQPGPFGPHRVAIYSPEQKKQQLHLAANMVMSAGGEGVGKGLGEATAPLAADLASLSRKVAGKVSADIPMMVQARAQTLKNGIPIGNDLIHQGAIQYAREHGIAGSIPDSPYVLNDVPLQTRIAGIYDRAVHAPEDPEVQAAYQAFAKEVGNQWNFATKPVEEGGLGITFEPWTRPGQPYKNSAEMRKDVADNHHLYFFQGGDLPADHPNAQIDPKTGFSINDEFRAVHDLFGHSSMGFDFGPRGEENAWREHAKMFSPEAQRALATETRGQNSWVNYGPHGAANQANKTNTIYADQKATLLPDGLDVPDFLAQAKAAELEDAEKFLSTLKRRPDGSYFLLPPAVTDAASLVGLRDRVAQLVREGIASRYWYENSAQALYDALGKNDPEAERFLQMLAVTSAKSSLPDNLTTTSRAHYQKVVGDPLVIPHIATIRDKVKDILEGKGWEGIKTNNFYENHRKALDPNYPTTRRGVTVDMHIGRGFEYPMAYDIKGKASAPTKKQYQWMTDEIIRLADKLGWEPYQVQAAMWSASKARNEAAGNAEKYRQLLRDYADYDFRATLQDALGQVSSETAPGRTSGLLPSYEALPPERKTALHQALEQQFQNDQGYNILANALQTVGRRSLIGPGDFEGAANPSSHDLMVVPKAAQTISGVPHPENAGRADPSAVKLLEALAAARGHLLRQDAVGWTRAFPATQEELRKGLANATALNIGRPIDAAEMADLKAALTQVLPADSHYILPTPRGALVVHTGDQHNNEVFPLVQQALEGVNFNLAEDAEPTISRLRADHGLVENNWQEHPNGEVYRQRIGASGVGHLLEALLPLLESRIAQVYREFGIQP